MARAHTPAPVGTEGGKGPGRKIEGVAAADHEVLRKLGNLGAQLLEACRHCGQVVLELAPLALGRPLDDVELVREFLWRREGQGRGG